MYFQILGLKGFLVYLSAKLTRSEFMFKLTPAELQHPVELRIPSSDIPAYKQIFIKQDYDFSVKRSPSTIVDAGANIGLPAIFFAARYPDARIIAVEPEQSNFRLLKKNTAPYPNILPVQAALWDRDEEIHLVDPSLGKWGFMTDAKHSCEKPLGRICHPVMGMRVDTLMKKFGLDRIDILKMDIEGAEKEVFNTSEAWIEKVDAIIIELHERMKPGCSRSFYRGSNGFSSEWQQGENIYLSRGNIRNRADTEPQDQS